MNEPARAAQPFRFYTRLHLSELTGLSASTFPRFLEILKNASDSCVYHHTHRFLQQHQHLSPEPPNDFAYWAAESMGDDELAEKLASIDTIRFSNLPALRDRIVAVVEEHLARTPNAALRRAAPGEEFYFIKAVSFVFPAPYVVWNLREFAEALRRVGIHSIYFHIFEAPPAARQEDQRLLPLARGFARGAGAGEADRRARPVHLHARGAAQETRRPRLQEDRGTR